MSKHGRQHTSDSMRVRLKTDRTLAEWEKRHKAPTVPDIHVHIDAQDEPTLKLPSWVKIALALGLPALALELVRRLLP